MFTDLLVYSIVIPVLPFQLERLGYHNVSGLVGWLLFGYVSCHFPRYLSLELTAATQSAGLVICAYKPGNSRE